MSKQIYIWCLHTDCLESLDYFSTQQELDVHTNKCHPIKKKNLYNNKQISIVTDINTIYKSMMRWYINN